MRTDFLLILQWWGLLFLLGILFLPLTIRLFNRFWDKGYPFAKTLAILSSSYFIWLFGSLKLIPFSRPTAWVIVICLGFLNLVFFVKSQKSKVKSQNDSLNLKTIFIKSWRIFLFEELLFLICLTLWSFVRGFQPDINGLEKFMDQGFVNTILRGQFFPPQDLWLAGHTINYYYFGHLVAALLTLLSGLSSAVTYNLMIATMFALSFCLVFSLSSNLLAQIETPRIKVPRRFFFLAGIISAFIICFASNFHTPYYVLKKGADHYWYPDATRYIGYNPDTEDKTIHEFPAYSFVVADLHGHLSDLPFVLLFLATLFAFSLRSKLEFSFSFFLLSFSLAIMYMTNSWDFPIYFLIFGLVVLWKNVQNLGWQFTAFKNTFLLLAFSFLLSALFSLPFHLHFKQIAQGVAFVNAHSPFYQLFVLWGFYWLIALSFLFFLFKGRLLRFFQPEFLLEKIASFFNTRIKILKRKTIPSSAISFLDGFILIILLVATLLLIIPEIIYVKDIYIASYHRANTMFKLTYQAYVLYAVSTGYIITRLLATTRHRLLLFTFYFLLFSLILIYPYFSVRSYYGLKNYRGLDGLFWLKNSYPDDYQAILWLQKNVKKQPVILEAVGESYTEFSRVSANTGLITVLGWPVHEWLWRGSYDEAGKRREEVRQIYEEGSLSATKELLKKYQAQYLFLGDLERRQYTNLAEDKIEKLGKPVFQSGTTIIFRLD